MQQTDLKKPRRTHPRLDALEAAARSKGRLNVAVAYPCSIDSLGAALAARDEGMIEPILVGPRKKIQACADALKVSLEGIRLVDAEDDPVGSSRAAVALASSGEAGALMKGSQHTDELLGAVVAREANLRTSRRISHVFWFDLPAYHKPLMVTDAVVNIAPTLQNKVDILANAIDVAHALGVQMPKVSLLSAIETVNPDLQSSVDAATLAKMADRGQIKGAIVDGPLAFDNSISTTAAATKGISSSVAGDPDILMVANLDVGNTLYKSFIYMGGGECAGVIVGARLPIILTSRADSRRARIASCALARLL
ncbi:bifunctional enoyl-CoA hydratase/phosphate acetyltransferase [Bradyrhizobium sp. NP1]|uniref:bifunctional enoyl-CoA hydratase/phosphate acetyltransferase n=1 Tax=Bradyrhizobium sp. NP1 TaxID=3049772 RepID=UPI0025A59050|nr:bifunctional enoyl-CoA hydratase/phosphate acetyltransferase [Bradyrhizobium sp. NP1]WJR75884.1 bifunctional enoyl-CoA hydratase/phosphate acetyltransferase [Bradyrhizobium sp. NP1]